MGETLTPRRPWKGRRVFLGVTGGIAAYKVVQVARDLTRLGATVEVAMTESARRFVGPLSFEGVTGRPIWSDPWSLPESGEGIAPHILLGHRADVVCVAPATADLLARAAIGRASDLVTATLLVTRAPVLLCPAMNDRMYAHPQVEANLRHLERELGYQIVGPAVGPLAAGEGEGPGRMVEPSEIVAHVGRALGGEEAFAGRTVLVTAGPTREPMDPVRYVGNRSSGRTGYALAQAAWRRGARVVLVSGPVERPEPVGVEIVRCETAEQMDAAVRAHLGEADVAIFAAAVADYRPAEVLESKRKRSSAGAWQVELVPNPDVAGGTKELRKGGAVVVGFALETDDLEENARLKRAAKAFDLVVANPTGPDTGFESETNQVTLVTDDKVETLPLLGKDEVAERILDRVASLMGGAAERAPDSPEAEVVGDPDANARSADAKT